MAEDDQKIGHPKQRKKYDLSVEHRELRRDGLPAPSFKSVRSDQKSPEDLMRELGFEPTKDMTPLQFLLAVTNDRLDLIFKNETRRKRIEGKGGLAMQYRLEAAKTAVKYTEMEMPKMQIQSNADAGFGEQLQNAIASGMTRVIQRETIIREIERISPDVPLAPASYPPDFHRPIIDAEIEDLSEGDTDYDPDRNDTDDDE